MAIWMCLLPGLLVISSLSTFLVSYAISVTHNHTDAFLPYISDTATTPPECCIFALMTFIAAMTSVGTMYAQYEVNKQLFERESCTDRKVVNNFLFGVGLSSCLGMCVVATFQVTIMGTVHRVGAVMFFVAGVMYIFTQTCIMLHPAERCCMFCIRLLISIIAVIALFSMLICIPLVESKKHWTGHEKDYGLYITSTVCEWVVALCFVSHFGTYCYEFWDCTFTVAANLGNSYEQLEDRNSSDRGLDDS